MSEEQIKNSIELCKNQPVSKVLMLMNYWHRDDISTMAKYFKCDDNETAVAAHLINGR